jgi:hypothetical protein
MKIRNVDSKNRVTVNAQHEMYTEVVHGDGSITLTPVKMPDAGIPKPLERGDLQGVYVKVSVVHAHPATITIHAAIPGLQAVADLVTELTEKLGVPAIIDARGVGAGVVDLVKRQSSQQVVEVYK